MYEDLRAHPSIFLPEKELGILLEPGASGFGDCAQYENLFRHARKGQVLGEVSSPYAKLPESAGVAARAVGFLGNDLRIVYLVRNPVDRVVSHHHHAWSRGFMSGSIDEAVRDDPRLLNYTRYATQLRPWSELVGPENVRVVKFEHYINDRVAVLRSLFDFLGAPPESPGDSHHRAYNVSVGSPVAMGRRGRIARSSVYRRVVRPLMPEAVRRAGGRALLPKSSPRPDPPSPSSVDLILNEIMPELVDLPEMCDSGPLSWDVDATRQQYLELRESTRS